MDISLLVKSKKATEMSEGRGGGDDTRRADGEQAPAGADDDHRIGYYDLDQPEIQDGDFVRDEDISDAEDLINDEMSQFVTSWMLVDSDDSAFVSAHVMPACLVSNAAQRL